MRLTTGSIADIRRFAYGENLHAETRHIDGGNK